MPAQTNQQASGKIRDASFGIVIAVIAATLVWAVVIGLCFYLFQ